MNPTVRREGNVYYLFGQPPERESMPTAVAMSSAVPAVLAEPDPAVHPLDQYLAFLRFKNLVTQAEVNVLRQAFEPLRARFNGLETVSTVRDEIRAREETLDTISQKEKVFWEQPHDELPFFDLQSAYKLFLADPLEAKKNLFFLNDAARAAHEGNNFTYVLPEMKDAEVFFWIIVACTTAREPNPEDLITDPSPPSSATRFG